MDGIAFIGFGEAGSALVKGWGPGTHSGIVAFDLKTQDPATRDAQAAHCEAHGVRATDTLEEALRDARVIISVVTADQAMAVARDAADHITKDAMFFDLNSCAPSSKQTSAELIDGAGGRYVDVAVMAPVYPALNQVPLLISGPYAEAAKPVLEALPMNFRIVPGDVGRASTIKMVRSVLIKGQEALTAEFMLAVAAADVADEVLPTLGINFPGFDWGKQASVNFERCMVHGVRRAAEMVEVAKTLEDLGLPPGITKATVDWQTRLAAVQVAPPEDPPSADPVALAASLLPDIRS